MTPVIGAGIDGVDEHNDDALAAAGVTVPAPPPNRPSITPAQIIAGVTALIGQAVAFGILDPGTAQNAISQLTLDLPIALIAGDALLRLGRNIAHGLQHKGLGG